MIEFTVNIVNKLPLQHRCVLNLCIKARPLNDFCEGYIKVSDQQTITNITAFTVYAMHAEKITCITIRVDYCDHEYTFDFASPSIKNGVNLVVRIEADVPIIEIADVSPNYRDNWDLLDTDEYGLEDHSDDEIELFEADSFETRPLIVRLGAEDKLVGLGDGIAALTKSRWCNIL